MVNLIFLTSIKRVLFVLCLAPLGWLLGRAWLHQLGSNPIETITRFFGDWALYFLLITLAITPLRRLTGYKWLLPLRRMLGLYCFSYALLHLSSYVVLDQFFEWREIFTDILKRPYITIGMLSFLLLVPLAVTSTRKMQRRLGRHWARLHSSIYFTSFFILLHYNWMVKADKTLPTLLALLLIVLLAVRLFPKNMLK